MKKHLKTLALLGRHAFIFIGIVARCVGFLIGGVIGGVGFFIGMGFALEYCGFHKSHHDLPEILKAITAIWFCVVLIEALSAIYRSAYKVANENPHEEHA